MRNRRSQKPRENKYRLVVREAPDSRRVIGFSTSVAVMGIDGSLRDRRGVR